MGGPKAILIIAYSNQKGRKVEHVPRDKITKLIKNGGKSWTFEKETIKLIKTIPVQTSFKIAIRTGLYTLVFVMVVKKL